MKQHLQLVEAAASLPKRDPKPLPPRDPSLWKKIFTERKTTKEHIRDVSSAAYRVLASAMLGTTVLEERVPIAQVDKRLCYHLQTFVAAAMMRGRLPLTIHMTDRYQAHLDFGHGRVLSLRVQLHGMTDVRAPTVGSFLVEEHALPSPEFDVFGRPDQIQLPDGVVGSSS